jgi:hypothetical protein
VLMKDVPGSTFVQAPDQTLKTRAPSSSPSLLSWLIYLLCPSISELTLPWCPSMRSTSPSNIPSSLASPRTGSVGGPGHPPYSLAVGAEPATNSTGLSYDPRKVYPENGRFYHAWPRGKYLFPCDDVRPGCVLRLRFHSGLTSA